MSDAKYDAFLLVSFGGPEGKDDVMPFLENVLRGKNVPRERMLEVAEHYYHFGGVSPINAQNRQLLAALGKEFTAAGVDLPIYWGNRNWTPYLPETLEQMRQDGVRRAIAFFTSVFSSYSGCRQYRENIAAAQQQVGQGAPVVDKVRMAFNHPGYIETMTDRVAEALRSADWQANDVLAIFTAHSIPQGMADRCSYAEQFHEASRLVAAAAGLMDWQLAYQSRSGPPSQPWLEPDVGDAIVAAATQGKRRVLLTPIGFVSDHMEVLYDLDDEAAKIGREHGVEVVRAATAGTHPRFVRMIRELVVERITNAAERPSLGDFGASHDVCPVDCCQSGRPAPGAAPARS